MDIDLIISRLKEIKNIKSDADLADYLGVKQPNIPQWRRRNSINLELIFSKCNREEFDYVMYGEQKDAKTPHPQHSPNMAGIPLVEIEAVAGFGNADFAITEQDVKDYYIVPEFSLLHIDFMLKIRGSSMYPKYNSGDVVACTIIKERNFIQWNRCHIIATASQGILCKRLLPSERKGYIRAVSDNTSYPPFEIPEEDITGIALVVGVVRME